ncbi:MAG TPA: hypothetical protein VGK74_15050 [Symbiobacteriaceae bacterium]
MLGLAGIPGLALLGALIVKPAALPVWTGAGRPGLPWNVALTPMLAVDVALPLVLLVSGYWLMTKIWETNG